MPLYDHLTAKLDFKRKFNHHQSFLYKGRLTVRTIRKFRTGSSVLYKSNPESEVRFELESNLEASQVTNSNVCRRRRSHACERGGWSQISSIARFQYRCSNANKRP